MRRARTLLAALLSASALLFAPAARASDSAAAREQLKVGYDLAHEGKCDEAIPHLAESLRLDPKAITLINLADCEEKVGKLADALGHWVDARARALSESNTNIEAEATKRATALEPRLPKLAIIVAADAPADTEVLRDGVLLGKVSLKTPAPVNPGAHKIEVRAAGRASATYDVTVAEGATERIEVFPGPAAPAEAKPKVASESRVFTYVGFGVGAAGVIAGSVTGLMALGEASKVRSECPDHECTPAGIDAVDSGRTLGTVSTISFIVAGVGVAVGVFGLLATPSKSPPPAAAASVASGWSFGPGGVRGRF